MLLPEEMDHNNLDIIADFIAPLSEFFDNFSIHTNNSEALKSKSSMRTEMPDLSKIQHLRFNMEDMDDIDECSEADPDRSSLVIV